VSRGDVSCRGGEKTAGCFLKLQNRGYIGSVESMTSERYVSNATIQYVVSNLATCIFAIIFALRNAIIAFRNSSMSVIADYSTHPALHPETTKRNRPRNNERNRRTDKHHRNGEGWRLKLSSDSLRSGSGRSRVGRGCGETTGGEREGAVVLPSVSGLRRGDNVKHAHLTGGIELIREVVEVLRVVLVVDLVLVVVPTGLIRPSVSLTAFIRNAGERTVGSSWSKSHHSIYHSFGCSS
jgi:hypothetical protein